MNDEKPSFKDIHLQSKTNGALLILLVVIIGLSLAGKLTQEAVEALKWIGSSFFVVRMGANVAENIKK
jgi:hypothetical protein